MHFLLLELSYMCHDLHQILPDHMYLHRYCKHTDSIHKSKAMIQAADEEGIETFTS